MIGDARRIVSERTCLVVYLVAACQSILFTGPVSAADMDQARQAFYRGDYESCIEISRAEVEKGIWNDFWARQLIEALLVQGRYEDAREVYELVQPKFPTNLTLRMLAVEAYRYCGQADVAKRMLDEIPEMVQSARWRFTDRDNMLAIGKYSLTLGEDARNVLGYYDAILKQNSKNVDAHVAIAELALDKADYQEAVKSLDMAVELQPENPHTRYLLAKAWAPSDSEQAAEHLQHALELNPYHPESMLFQAQNRIDSEDYGGGVELLGEVLKLNPSNPQAWALKAAIAHLQGAYADEGAHRKKALELWALNPVVDHLIGRTLSQHYRFAESVKYQRRALQMDPKYIPAKFQLAQDLLRAGADDEGWTLVGQVAADDKYNVIAFNLRTLQDRLAEFTTIDTGELIIRMDSREARIYGARVVELLEEAKRTLCNKYAMTLKQPVTIEIFTQQSDFAIRTFGLPGGAGFLGVCFGSLITANSPASQGDAPSNWESVLWHEFCHVVTLQKTNNRMPRWLSEGISVYEELEHDSSWGQSMSPIYKSMILGEDFVPLSQLSGAFLRPKSAMHLQFAYFESSLAVRYLVDAHGLPLLQRLLVDLGMGLPVAEAFARRYGDTEALDADFERYAKEAARSYAPEAEFSQEGLPRRASELDLEQWIKDNPGSYAARRQLISRLMEAEQWELALEQAQQLRQLIPNDAEAGGALELISACARELDKPEIELEALEQIAVHKSDNLPALLRLLTIHREAERWDELHNYATKLLSLQPLIPSGHEAMVLAAKQLGQTRLAINSLRALQEMEPVDPAGLHFELAEALSESDMIEEARIEALLALEYSPRYREAQKLLVQVHQRLKAAEEAWTVALPEIAEPPDPEDNVREGGSKRNEPPQPH